MLNMPPKITIRTMGDWGRRLLDGLLTGGQKTSLERWPTAHRIHISLVAPSCAAVGCDFSCFSSPECSYSKVLEPGAPSNPPGPH
eukprot:1155405-Pelagomonas_calceolata.AAC.1